MSEKMNCLEKEFQNRVDELVANKEEASEGKPKIQKVPAILRDKKDSKSNTYSEIYFEPMWMSIGPIHHGQPKFQIAEKYKLKLAAKFIREGGYRNWRECYDNIKDDLRSFEQFIDKEISEKFRGTNDENNLSLILFFDGCAVLQFISSSCNDDLREIKLKNDQLAFMTHDLFLLENQIPYQVLARLIETRGIDNEKKRLRDSIVEFISRNIVAPEKYQEDIKQVFDCFDKPVHLLDLLLLALLRKSDQVEKKNDQPNSASTVTGLSGNISSATDLENQGSSATALQSKSRDQNRVNQFNNGNVVSNPNKSSNCSGSKPRSDKLMEQQSFRSVMDLKSTGISFKPSKTSSLGDITFSSIIFAGKLSLPPLLVDDSTCSKFMNLIAYEMCPDNIETKYEVTSYIAFLDSLIDYPSDVKELRSSMILHNLLGCDKEVAALFNSIATDLVPNRDVYRDVIDKIEKHYKSTWMTWMAQVYTDHFSSPWTIVAFIAAMLAIGMSAIQTWYNVNPKDGPCENFCKLNFIKKLP